MYIYIYMYMYMCVYLRVLSRKKKHQFLYSIVHFKSSFPVASTLPGHRGDSFTCQALQTTSTLKNSGILKIVDTNWDGLCTLHSIDDGCIGVLEMMIRSCNRATASLLLASILIYVHSDRNVGCPKRPTLGCSLL